MLNCENRNCKYAQVWKQKLQVCSTVKKETGSMHNYDNKKLPVRLTMEIETPSKLNYVNGHSKYA